MVTITKSVWLSGEKYYREAYGKSTDKKPREGFANGSRFYEMDTSKTYRYDEETDNWLLWTGSSGGGGGGGDTPEYATDAEVDEALDAIFPN